MAPYSKEDLLESYRTGMHAVAGEMALLIGREDAARVARLTVDELDDVESKNCSSAEVIKTDAARLLDEVYEFAFNGLLGDRLADEWEESEGLTPWVERFDGLRQFVSWEYDGSFGKCIHTLRVAHVRGLFSGGAHFPDPDRGMVWNCMSLQEFALLAGLEAKTLRNIASPRHRQHLPTTKLGKRTYVALSDALPWLRARGFRPSVYVSTDVNRDFGRRPFLSKEDLATFVQAQQARLDVNNEQLAAKLTDTPKALERLQAIDESSAFVDETFAARLAQVLGVPNSTAFAQSAAELAMPWKAEIPVSAYPRRKNKER